MIQETRPSLSIDSEDFSEHYHLMCYDYSPGSCRSDWHLQSPSSRTLLDSARSDSRSSARLAQTPTRSSTRGKKVDESQNSSHAIHCRTLAIPSPNNSMSHRTATTINSVCTTPKGTNRLQSPSNLRSSDHAYRTNVLSPANAVHTRGYNDPAGPTEF
jgi:hypothetical protein